MTTEHTGTFDLSQVSGSGGGVGRINHDGGFYANANFQMLLYVPLSLLVFYFRTVEY